MSWAGVLRPLVIANTLLSLLLWGYAGTLLDASRYWSTPEYSHGGIVVVFAVALLWLRRKGGREDLLPDSVWEWMAVGIAFVAIAISFFVPPKAAWKSVGIAEGGLASYLFVLGLVIWANAAAIRWLRDHTASAPLVDWVGIAPPVAAWTGATVLAAGIVLRLVLTHFGLDVPEMYTFPIALLGVVILVFGFAGFRWAWPVPLFLLFMFPLPYSVEQQLLVPLQGLAADGATFLLQTLGYEAANETGHFVRLGALRLGVVEQCSGLRMATVFVALAVGTVLVLRLPKWQIPIVLLSAVPIALAVNILRITATAVAMVEVNQAFAERFFHDWAGYLMPLLAVILLAVELRLLDLLVYAERESDVPIAAGPPLP